ncbi:glycine betaine ABC transporter substrate-binding protein [Sulfurovum sp. CS9]|uniref:glycine betaine ABC transporter substrate-binding protein n=1 Tax=Sulfurovum sp. CS9 TaxID=3391146 RepID=UPI0039E93C29
MKKIKILNVVKKLSILSVFLVVVPIYALEKNSKKPFWPNDAQLVISISMQFEATAQDASDPGPFPVLEKYVDTIAPTWYQYGMNEGIPRLLRLWDKHNIKVTSHMVGKAVELNPDLAKEVVKRGHEASGHGQTWTPQYSMGETEERDSYIESANIIEKVTGVRPVGFNAFWMRHSPNTLKILQELGFIYHIDDLSRDEPSFTPVNEKSFVVVPYSFRNNDIVRYSGSTALTGAVYLQNLKDEFDLLYEEGKTQRRMMSISVHDRLATPARVKALDNFIAYAKKHKNVVFMRKDDIARWILKQDNVPVNPKRIFTQPNESNISIEGHTMEKPEPLLANKKSFLKRVAAVKGKSNKIVLGITDLSFHRVTGAVVAHILETMGFEVEQKFALHEENFRRLKDTEIDMLASAWLPSSHGGYKSDVEKSIDLVELGLHYKPYALWGVPDYIPENEISQISDLLKPQVVKKMRKIIQGIGIGAGITRFSIKMMDEYGLKKVGYEFKTGTQDECVAAYEDAVKKKKWVIVPLWQPQFLHNTYKIRDLKEPKGLLGVVDRAVLLVNKKKLNKIFTPEQIRLLDEIILSNQAISKLDYMTNREGLSEDEAVQKWFAD